MPKLKLRWNGRRTVKNLALVVLGTLILSFATAVFLVPFQLITGGISGISLVLDAIIPWELVTTDLLITVLTWAFFFLGLIFLGKEFALKTLVSAIVYPLGTALFGLLVNPDVLGGFFCLAGNPHGPEVALILAPVISGVCVGTGCAITFLGGGSTGGVDVLVFLLCKLFRRLKSSHVFFLVDATTIVCGMFVKGDMILSLLGILSAFLAATMIDKVFLGASRSFIAQIITEKANEINDAIIHKIDRTTTMFVGVGGYSGKEKRMLMVSFTMRQYSELFAVVNAIDPEAFITVHAAHEISGEGWTR